MPEPRAWISGPAIDLAAGGVDHHDHRQEALLAQDPPVLQRGLGQLADRQPVHVHVAGRHLAHHRRPPVDQVDDHAVLGDHDVLLRHAGLGGQLGVRPQVPPFAVHRDEVPRPDQVQHVQQLARGRVPGHVHQRVALVHHPGAETGQVVDDPRHRGLVAGHQRGGEHHGVALGDPDRVVPPGHTGQRGHRLALRPGGDQHDVLRRHLLRLARAPRSARRAPAARAGSRGPWPRPCCAPWTGRPGPPCGRSRPRCRAPAGPGARGWRSRPR